MERIKITQQKMKNQKKEIPSVYDYAHGLACSMLATVLRFINNSTLIFNPRIKH